MEIHCHFLNFETLKKSGHRVRHLFYRYVYSGKYELKTNLNMYIANV